eukprot:SM000071S21043  [mRNA]  locus=s71:50795:56673:- [translate_table: standard]
MEPDASIERACVVRVAVLPVGGTSAAAFRGAFALLARHGRIELSTASSFYVEHQKSPFALQPWDSGALHLRFVPGGAPRSPWEDFQASRRILGVIGLCHGPTAGAALAAAYDDFLAACRSYPAAQTHRCFAFDVDDAEVEQEGVVILPRGDQQLLDFHLATLMQEFGAALLMAFESWVLHAEPMGAFLSSPLDTQGALTTEEVWSSSTCPMPTLAMSTLELWGCMRAQAGVLLVHDHQVGKTKKKRLGRVQKAMGDFCLLAGSAQDAHLHYSTAAELARLTGDLFWLAGAIEGSLCALVVDREGARDALVEEEVRMRYSEVLQLYHRQDNCTPRPGFAMPLAGALIFELEATIKLAKFFSKRPNKVYEVKELLTAAIENSRQLLDPSDRVIFNMEVSRLFWSVGYKRKSGFFARQVAQLYLQADSKWAATAALHVLGILAPVYCLHGLGEASLETNKDLDQSKHHKSDPDGKKGALNGKDARPQGKSGGTVREEVEGQWSTLQMDILGDMLALAVKANDPLTAWKAASRLLRKHYPLITPTGQYSLAAALSASANQLPLGTRLHEVAPTSPELQVVKRTSAGRQWWRQSSGSGPFIYSPFVAASNAQSGPDLLWVCGEPAQVIVEVANPCAFDLTVESISLSVSASEAEGMLEPVCSSNLMCETPPKSISLPPNHPPQLLSLSCVPRRPGRLLLRGCFVRCFGVLSEHLFSSTGDAVAAGHLADPFRGSPTRAKALMPPGSLVAIPALPLLVASVLGGERASFVLFEGEAKEVDIRVTNAGIVPVSEVDIGISGRSLDHAAMVDRTTLEHVLPLLPGQSAMFTLVLHGLQATSVGRSGGTLTAKVEDSRKSAVPILAGSRSGKDAPDSALTIHYAGPKEAMQDAPLPPGRRLVVPLQLHVQRGLHLLEARVLTLTVPRKRHVMVFRLLELELWNGTDASFDVSVVVGGSPEGSSSHSTKGTSLTVDRECSARVLVPLKGLTLGEDAEVSQSSMAAGDKRLLGSRGNGNEAAAKQFVLPRDARVLNEDEEKAEAELEGVVAALCLHVRIFWRSSRNGHGELYIRDKVREALQGPTIAALLPDLLTFRFSLARAGGSIARDSATKAAMDAPGGAEEGLPSSPSPLSLTLKEAMRISRKGITNIVARKMTGIDLTVHNSGLVAARLELTLACCDVAGSSCLGATGSKATILWAGSLHRVDLDVLPRSSVVHQFALCFLVPGDYTLRVTGSCQGASADATASNKNAPSSTTCQPLGPPVAIRAFDHKVCVVGVA